MQDTPATESPPETHYDVLGVGPDASQRSVDKAYTALLAELRANPTAEMQDKVRRARIAYKVVSDPETRALYNAQLNLPAAPGSRWETHYLEEEEGGLKFWTGIAQLSVVAWMGVFWHYLLIKGVLAIPRALYRAVTSLLTRTESDEEPPAATS